eukprot:TRINITY_DN2072_c0_g1_i11.p1 TRINITY_DN2072_c0_g1~~TRINITY_DN2072_c0_g1_i11.p1  ORF type:complete len:359 (-),score=34.13 TRINITY_DN2072_c0_g1_i11:436-1512(-)
MIKNSESVSTVVHYNWSNSSKFIQRHSFSVVVFIGFFKMSEKALGQVLSMSLRCICLLVTAIILLTVVGWAFVAFQAIWTADLREEVDQLAATNDLLEENLRTFNQNNVQLQKEGERLENTIGALRLEVSNYSQLNDDLTEDIEELNVFTIDLENTVLNTTIQTTLLVSEADAIVAQVPALRSNVAYLNTTSQTLEEELVLLRELELNTRTFSNSSRESFDEIRQTTDLLFDQVSNIVLVNMEAVLQGMANNLEFTEQTVLPGRRAGFTEGEYSTWLSHIAFVLPQTQEELAEQYPFKPDIMSNRQVTRVIRQIVQQETERLGAQRQGGTLGFFEDTPILNNINGLFEHNNRKMLFTI